jgi:hypothetical protein
VTRRHTSLPRRCSPSGFASQAAQGLAGAALGGGGGGGGLVAGYWQERMGALQGEIGLLQV